MEKHAGLPALVVLARCTSLCLRLGSAAHHHCREDRGDKPRTPRFGDREGGDRFERRPRFEGGMDGEQSFRAPREDRPRREVGGAVRWACIYMYTHVAAAGEVKEAPAAFASRPSHCLLLAGKCCFRVLFAAGRGASGGMQPAAC